MVFTSDQNANRRRPSADFLSPVASNLLSPGSGYNQRRRNSYAATTTNFNYEEARMTPTLSSSYMAGSHSSQHFLDPNSAAYRRRLPPTPLDLAAGSRVGSQEFIEDPNIQIRRSSSPRILPTPPINKATPSPTGIRQMTPEKDQYHEQQRMKYTEQLPLERKLSRRQLPPEPKSPPMRQQLQQEEHRLSVASKLGMLRPDMTGDSEGGFLQRSSSTRNPRENRYPKLVATSMHKSEDRPDGADLEIDRPLEKCQTSLLQTTTNRLERTTSAAVSMDTRKSSRLLATAMNEATTNKIFLPSPTTISITTATSAPATPRDGMSVKRKFSSTDASSITNEMTSLSLLRDGSMAHLLEQQHNLRREFTTTPDSANNTQSQSHSNSSSLSPSIEKLNYASAGGQGMSRSGSDAEDPAIHGLDPSLYIGTGAMSTTVASSITPSSSYSVQTSSGDKDLNGHTLQFQPACSSADEPRPRGLGLLHCTIQHFPVRKRLRVSVLKIEGLAGELRPDLEIQPFCKVTLKPGKKQQQHSVVKRGRDVVFNQEFFFDGVLTEEIDRKELNIEVCHQSAQKLQKDLDIGEVRISFKGLAQQLQAKKEVRIIEELKLLSASRKLGKLTLTSCIEKEARRLTINLIKVEDLPKWGIIGAPDVCIKIRMQQSSGPETTKSSRVIKNSTSAVFKEAVMFLISTKEADLLRTKITVSVHDLSRTVTGNDVIGSVYLGELAVDKTEIEQWKNTTDHWGKEYKGIHNLKSSQTPDVSVSEAHSDCENDE